MDQWRQWRRKQKEQFQFFQFQQRQKTNNVTIRSQKDANEYEGKTLTGTTSIYVDGSGIDLKDIRFKGDVDIYADDTATAAAYIGEDTAVAAANSTVDIYLRAKQMSVDKSQLSETLQQVQTKWLSKHVHQEH